MQITNLPRKTSTSREVSEGDTRAPSSPRQACVGRGSTGKLSRGPLSKHVLPYDLLGVITPGCLLTRLAQALWQLQAQQRPSTARGLQDRGLALRISREKGRAEGVGSPPRSWRVPGRILTTVGKTKNKVRQGLHFVIHHQHPAFRVLCPRTGRGGGFPPARRPLGPRKAELGQRRGMTEQEVSLTHALVLRRTCNGLGQAAFKTRPERKIRGQV